MKMTGVLIEGIDNNQGHRDATVLKYILSSPEGMVSGEMSLFFYGNPPENVTGMIAVDVEGKDTNPTK